MSVTFENSSDCSSIGNGKRCVSIPDSSSRDENQERRFGDEASLDSASSSIGKNSDLTGGGEDSGDSTEVESSFKGGPLDAMEALEEVLPIRRGISRFYNGKSKSFASLAHASSIQDLAKPDNAYTRKRRSLLASSLVWDKNRSSPLRSNGGGISKRTLTNLSRTNLALAVVMTTSSEANNDDSSSCGDLELSTNLLSPTSLPLQKPRPFMGISHIQRDFSAWRSFSLADLQCASTTIATQSTPHGTFCSTSSDVVQSHL